ncbi:MAG: hypothetical protein WCA35_15545 [Kovacikia sp.]
MPDSSLDIFTSRELQIGFLGLVLGILTILMIRLVKPSTHFATQFVSSWLTTLKV